MHIIFLLLLFFYTLNLLQLNCLFYLSFSTTNLKWFLFSCAAANIPINYTHIEADNERIQKLQNKFSQIFQLNIFLIIYRIKKHWPAIEQTVKTRANIIHSHMNYNVQINASERIYKSRKLKIHSKLNWTKKKITKEEKKTFIRLASFSLFSICILLLFKITDAIKTYK